MFEEQVFQFRVGNVALVQNCRDILSRESKPWSEKAQTPQCWVNTWCNTGGHWAGSGLHNQPRHTPSKHVMRPKATNPYSVQLVSSQAVGSGQYRPRGVTIRHIEPGLKVQGK